MKTLLVLASLAGSVATAGAHPRPMPPRPGTPAINATCRANGTPLYQIRYRADGKAETSTVSIYSTGAWRVQPVDADGNAGITDMGCLPRADLKIVRDALKASPWTVTHSRITCRAYSMFFTQYLVHGQLKYTQRLCSGDSLDAASQKAIATIATVLPQDEAVSRVSPDAKPMMEIRYRSEIAAPTSTVKLWPTGTLTVEKLAADGTSLGITRSGIDHTQLATIRQALRVAPFDITYSRIMCFAYSPSYTEYVVHGKVVYRAQMCSGAMADDVTLASLATIEQILPE